MSLTVTCGSTIFLNYSVGTQSVSLSATCAGATSWVWTLLSVPTGSTALSTVRGNFINGVATVQNPTFVTDAGLAGSYVFQCVGSNISGSSNPVVDEDEGQQLLIVRTQNLGLSLPGKYAYAWSDTYNLNYRILEDVYPNKLVNLNRALGATLDDFSGQRTPLSHALTGTLHTSTTLAQLNLLISDATLDTSTASRPTTGVAGGDLLGSIYPNPSISGILGVAVVVTGVQNNQCLTYSTSYQRLEPHTISPSIIGLGGVNFTTYVNQWGKIIVTDPTATYWQLATMDDIKPLWPRFSCNQGNTNRNQIFAGAPPGGSNNLRLILSDGRVYTATGPITINANATGDNARCVGDTLATGMWHIYAVPATSTTFKFVLSTKKPINGGPTGFSVYKYCWTVNFEGITGTVGVNRFIQAGRWYYPTIPNDITYRLLYWYNCAFLDSDNPGYNRWWRFDGTAGPYVYNGTSYVQKTPVNIANMVPVDWVKTITIQINATGSASGTVCDGGGNCFLIWMVGGNPPSQGATYFNGPWYARTGSAFTPHVDSYRLHVGGFYTGGSSTFNLCLVDKMMCMMYPWDITGRYTSSGNLGMWLRAYRNPLYGV